MQKTFLKAKKIIMIFERTWTSQKKGEMGKRFSERSDTCEKKIKEK